MQLCLLFGCPMAKPPLSLGPAVLPSVYHSWFEQHLRDLVPDSEQPLRAHQERAGASWMFQQTPGGCGQAAIASLGYLGHLQNPTM